MSIDQNSVQTINAALFVLVIKTRVVDDRMAGGWRCYCEAGAYRHLVSHAVRAPCDG
jgi:hypothetical protein